jgi:PAS domain S-box-containing protein
MRLNLTLSQKGFILVSLPLVCELVFVGTLTWLLHLSDQELKAAVTARDIHERTNDLIQGIYQTTIKLKQGFFRWTPKVDQEFMAVAEQIPEDVNTIYEASKVESRINPNLHDRGIVQKVERIKEITDQAVPLLVEVRNARLNGSVFEAKQVLDRNTEQIGPLKDELFDNLQAIINSQREIENELPHRQDAFRRMITMVLFAGVAFNILLAFCLALFFNREAADRLQVLMDNTRRLATGKPLNPPLPGNDEIAHLDKVFNDMAQALEAAMRKERAIVQNAMDVICSFDDRGIFTSVSPASRAQLGYEPEQLIGKEYIDFVFADDRKAVAESVGKIMEGKASGQFESRLLKSDGSLLDVLWSVQWADIENSMFCVVHDITARKEIERMKQEFVAMVSHDLRTPLTSIQGYLTLLSTGMYGELNDQGTHNLKVADANITRLIGLINDLLDIEKMESGKLKMELGDVTLAEVFERSIGAVVGFAQQQKVSLMAQPTALHAFADGDRLVQVLVNLISNAIKFSPKDSTVTLSASDFADFVEITVSDQGRGIPAEFKSSIFERFQQVQASDAKVKGGSGLGLAICKAIVEGHSGTIGVDSEEGKGSRFWFRIPKPMSTIKTVPADSVPVVS